MIKRTNLTLIFIAIFSTTIVTDCLSESYPNSRLLATADSLFQNERYTQAFVHYDSLFNQHEIYTPAMLLKMAYIKEGLNEYDEALYFLNLHYLATSNKTVLNKMDQLAKEKELIGFEYDDEDFFFNFYHKFKPFILVFLLVVSFLLIVKAMQLKKQNENYTSFAIVSLIICGAALYLSLFSIERNYGIVVRDNTLVMKSPSSGSDVQSLLGKGNRLKIYGSTDVWKKIRLKEEEEQGYIRESNIRIIQL